MPAWPRKQGLFDFGDVVEAVTDKMIRRHPHVFGGDERQSRCRQARRTGLGRAEEPSERQGQGQTGLSWTMLPRALPALLRAEKLQRRASSVGFDWDDAAQGGGQDRRGSPRGRWSAPDPGQARGRDRRSAVRGRQPGPAPESRSRRRPCAPPTPNSPAASSSSRTSCWPSRDPAEASLEEMEALWQKAKAKAAQSNASQPPDLN